MDENPYQSPPSRREVPDPATSNAIPGLAATSVEFLYLCCSVANVLAVLFLLLNFRMMDIEYYGEDLLFRPSFWIYQAIAWVVANSMFVFARFIERRFPCDNWHVLGTRALLASVATIFFAIVFFFSVHVSAKLSM
jgi:hypothetical protein